MIFMINIIKSIYNKEKENFDKKTFIYIFLVTIIGGLIIHGYGYINVAFNHDTLIGFDQANDIQWKIQIGRFMQMFSIYFRGFTPVPWITGILSLVYMSIGNYLLIKTVNIKNKTNILLIVLLFLGSLSFTVTNVIYFHENDAFMLAYLFSILAVYVFKEYKYGYIITPLFITISCGFYQAYLCVSIVLFLLLLINKIMNKKKIKNIFIYGTKILGIIFAGVILYYLCQSLMLIIFNIEKISGYNTVDNSFNILNNLHINILDSYLSFAGAYFTPVNFNTTAMTIINSLLLLLISYNLIIYFKEKKLPKGHIISLIFIIALIPLAACFMNVLTSGLLHYLMIFAASLSYVLILFICEKNKTAKWLYITIYIILSVNIYNNFLFINNSYLERDINYQETHTLFTNILYDIEKSENYIPGETEVIILGDINSRINIYKHFEDYVLHVPTITYPGTYKAYINNILNTKININTSSEIIDIYKSHEQIINNKSYPHPEYIQIIDKKVIVKVS